MLTIPDLSKLSQRLPAGLRLAGLAAAAGLAYGLAAASPAAAASPMMDWHTACQDKASPQGYGESIRYNNCMHQRYCQEMANAGSPMMGAGGCFGVQPQTPAAEYVRRPAR